MELESFIGINPKVKLRQNIRFKDVTNKCDVKYTFELKRVDLFEMVRNILSNQKE
jgi:hypothetical protein